MIWWTDGTNNGVGNKRPSSLVVRREISYGIDRLYIVDVGLLGVTSLLKVVWFPDRRGTQLVETSQHTTDEATVILHYACRPDVISINEIQSQGWPIEGAILRTSRLSASICSTFSIFMAPLARTDLAFPPQQICSITHISRITPHDQCLDVLLTFTLILISQYKLLSAFG